MNKLRVESNSTVLDIDFLKQHQPSVIIKKQNNTIQLRPLWFIWMKWWFFQTFSKLKLELILVHTFLLFVAQCGVHCGVMIKGWMILSPTESPSSITVTQVSTWITPDFPSGTFPLLHFIMMGINNIIWHLLSYNERLWWITWRI